MNERRNLVEKAGNPWEGVLSRVERCEEKGLVRQQRQKMRLAKYTGANVCSVPYKVVGTAEVRKGKKWS